MATKWLERALFHLPMCFALFTDEASFLREIKDKWWNMPAHNIPPFPTYPTNAKVVFVSREGSMPAALVCIRKMTGYSRASIYAMLTHEAVHIWQEARRAIQESEPSDEFEAYSVQSIARALFDAYDAQMKAKRARR